MRLPADVRRAAVSSLCRISSPQGTDLVMSDLMKEFDTKVGCHCPACTVEAAVVATNVVVLEELLKMTPASSEAGVAGLMHKLNQAHLAQFTSFANAVLSIVERASACGLGPGSPALSMPVGVRVIPLSGDAEDIKEAILGKIKEMAEANRARLEAEEEEKKG